MPEVCRLPLRKTWYAQFGSIPEDEGSIDGTYRVHDNIFRQQLKLEALKRPGQAAGPSDFGERLWLVHGDQLTALRI